MPEAARADSKPNTDIVTESPTGYLTTRNILIHSVKVCESVVGKRSLYLPSHFTLTKVLNLFPPLINSI